MPEVSSFPPPLLRLAALAGEVLGGPPAPLTAIDDGLLALALYRHQIGPVLYAAANGRHPASFDGQRVLERSYNESACRHAAVMQRLNSIAVEFAAHNIAWMTLKGAPQAARLYADPAWRHSSDIDLLVTPRDMRRAIAGLSALGYIASNPPMPPAALQGAVFAAVRDIHFLAEDDRTTAIELHQRLFFAAGRRVQALRLPVSGDIPAPTPGPELAVYLILHGAQSFWVRLKWLMDLVPLFARLSGPDMLVIPDLTRRLGAEHSAAASLLLLRALFPFVTMTPLNSWLETNNAQPAVRHRLLRYAEMLSLDSDRNRSPLDNARLQFEAQWLAFEAPSTRLSILAQAPLSWSARRIAAVLNPADRALTVWTEA